MEHYRRGRFYILTSTTSSGFMIYGPQDLIMNAYDWHEAVEITDALHTAYLMGQSSVQWSKR